MEPRWKVSCCCVLCLLVLLAYCDGHTQYGSQFVIAVPFSNGTGNVLDPGDFHLVLSNPGSTPVAVVILRNDLSVLGSHVVPAFQSVISPLSPGSEYMLPAEGLSNTRTLHLQTSETDQFGVMVQGTQAYDGYLAIPLAAWGDTYTVATHCRGGNSRCQIVVIAQEDFTQVNITLPSRDNTFSLGLEPDPDTTLVVEVMLMRHECWVVGRKYDLTGATVSANTSVGVLSGAARTSYSGQQGALSEALPPTPSLGTEYITPGPTGTLRIVATSPHTTIRLPALAPVRLAKVGQWYEVAISSYVYLRADWPVLAVLVGRARLSAAHPGYPVMLVLTPVLRFTGGVGGGGVTTTLLPSLSAEAQTLVVVTRQRSQDKILYDSQPLSALSNLVTTDRVPDAYYAVNVITPVIDGSSHTVSISGDSNDIMALYVMGMSSNCSLFAPLGVRFDVISGVTNDESGTTPDDELDSWGHRFVLVIPEHLLDNNFTLGFSSLDPRSGINITVSQPDGTQVSTLTMPANSYSSATVVLSADAANVLSGQRSDHVTRVTSEAEVSAIVYFQGPTYGGSMRLIPVDALGREYYVVASRSVDPNNDQFVFQVAGVLPDTSLDVHLRMAPAATCNVTFLGMTYFDGDVIRTNLTAYLAVQLGAYACDMTGTLVTGSKPIAVFVISIPLQETNTGRPTSPLMEQLPPLEAYGRHFIVRQQTARYKDASNFCQWIDCKDRVYVIASEPNTTLKVANGESSTPHETHVLARGGDSLTLMVNSSTFTMLIEADRAVLVIQTLTTLPKNRAEMLVVTPVSQYVPHDVLVLNPESVSSLRMLVVLSAEERDAFPVLFNNSPIPRAESVVGPSFNASYQKFDYPAGTAIDFTELTANGSGRFGGYFSEIGTKESITSLAHGLKRVNKACLVTYPVRGDGVDNDCDGTIDEEDCDVGESLKDGDGDGRYNEDCVELITTTQEETTITEVTTPEVTTSEATTTQEVATTPEATTPEATTPEATTPEVTTPEVTTPEATTPEATTTPAVATTPVATTPELTTTPEVTTTPEAPTTQDLTTVAVTPEVTTTAGDVTTTATTTTTNTEEKPTTAQQGAAPDTTTLTTATTAVAVGSTPSTPTPIPIPVPSTSAPRMCTCSCVFRAVNVTALQPEAVSLLVSSIVSELSVNKTLLSARRRTKTSAPDYRQSAQTIGYVGIVAIAVMTVVIVLADFPALYRDVRNLVMRCKGG